MLYHTLIRSYLEDKTVGWWTTHTETYFRSLELPWKLNKVNVSCIPEGTYLIKRDHTGRHRFYRFDKVEGRTDIEVHIAARVELLLGCIALGKDLTANKNLLDSEEAMNEFLDICGDEDITLQIRSFDPVMDSWITDK